MGHEEGHGHFSISIDIKTITTVDSPSPSPSPIPIPIPIPSSPACPAALTVIKHTRGVRGGEPIRSANYVGIQSRSLLTTVCLFFFFFFISFLRRASWSAGPCDRKAPERTRWASGSGTGLEFAILGAAPAPPRQPTPPTPTSGRPGRPSPGAGRHPCRPILLLKRAFLTAVFLAADTRDT